MLAKLIDTKTLPDSAKAKHILIQTYDPQAKKQLLDDSTAKKRIDSISLAIKNGANFDSLAKKFSDDNKGPDGGSAAKGGDLGWFGYGRMVSEFNDFCFEKPVGSRDIVKTSFGYHLIEVTGQKSPQLNYKVAYLTERIVASQQTEDNAVQQATDFAGDVKDPKSFDAAYEKTLKPKGINKGIGIDIKRTDGSVRGLGFSRQLIKDIYAAKPGEVLRPIQVGNDWVVAVVTESISEGTQSVTKVRPGVEPLLRNKKIAEQLKQKIGKVSKIEAAASVMGKQPQIVDSLRMSAPQALLSYDPKVFGAIFNPANKGKIVPEAIIGDQGVYVVQVDNVTATAPENSNVAEMRKNQAGQTANDPIGALKKAASIKDKRSSGIY
jgi:peptidyl-prolyl cis-trans isomerase D